MAKLNIPTPALTEAEQTQQAEKRQFRADLAEYDNYLAQLENSHWEALAQPQRQEAIRRMVIMLARMVRYLIRKQLGI